MSDQEPAACPSWCEKLHWEGQDHGVGHFGILVAKRDATALLVADWGAAEGAELCLSLRPYGGLLKMHVATARERLDTLIEVATAARQRLDELEV